jgi:hypothetical protein
LEGLGGEESLRAHYSTPFGDSLGVVMRVIVDFEDKWPREFLLGSDGNMKTAFKHDFDCLQTSPCGFGDTYEAAIIDLCKQLHLVPVSWEFFGWEDE